jgi:ankyrin repeat protein
MCLPSLKCFLRLSVRVKDMLDPANIDRKGDIDMAFDTAAETGQLEVASWLLDKGADLHITNSDGATALHHAAEGGKLEVVKWLVEEKGMDVTQTMGPTEDDRNLFHCAARGGNLELLRWLADEKKLVVDAKDGSGQTALFHAIQFGFNFDAVKWLVDEKKLGIDDVSNDGFTPLLVAASQGWLDLIKWLVIEKKQVVRDMRTLDGWSALDLASSNTGSLEFIKWLVEDQRMDPGASNPSGWTALHHAALCDSLDVVQYLVEEKGVKVDIVTEDGDTPLSLARYRVCKWLKAWMKQD